MEPLRTVRDFLRKADYPEMDRYTIEVLRKEAIRYVNTLQQFDILAVQRPLNAKDKAKIEKLGVGDMVLIDVEDGKEYGWTIHLCAFLKAFFNIESVDLE